MNAEPKSTWAEFVEQPRRFFLWLALMALLALAVCFVVEMAFPGVNLSPGLRSVAVFVLVGLVGGFIVGFFGFFLALVSPLQPLMRWIARRSAFWGACLITLVALFYAVEGWRGKRAWENFKRAAEAQGEAFELKSIIPPPVPDEQNVAATPLFKELCHEFDREWRDSHTGPRGLTNAADRLKFEIGRESNPWPEKESANWMIGRRTDLKAWQEYYRNQAPSPGALERYEQARASFAERYGLPPEASGITPPTIISNTVPNEFPVAPQPQAPALDVLLALSKFDSLVEELRVAGMRSRARFPIRYEDGFNALLPHLARLKSISQFLRLRTAAELEAGRTNEAAADVELSLRLVDLVHEEPLLISQLVRLAQLQLALNPLWEGLAEHRWTDAQLAGFEQRLGQFDFLADYQRAMRGERAYSASTIDYVRRLRDPNILGMAGDQAGNDSDAIERLFGAVFFHLIPRGWFEQNKVSVGRIHLELMKPAVDLEARRVSPSNVSRLNDTMGERLKNRSPYNWFGGLLLPALGSASARFAQGQAAVDMARVACALERYRLAHGQYPETLDALTPRFIPKPPHDVISGRPLNYRRAGPGSFVLYSVGWNEKDDGGTVVPNKDKRAINWKEGDWVWQYASK